jgi:hypothetical protein
VDQPIYREVQHFFRQWIFLLPVGAVTIIVWYEFIQQVVLGSPQGERPIPNGLAWVLTIIFGLGFPAAGLIFSLVTEVRPGELTVRVFPFRWARIPVGMISQAMVRSYSPIKEYGGWGVRVNRHNGRAFNCYGNEGVQLLLSNGTPVLVGSQRAHELLAALEKAGFKAVDAKTPAEEEPSDYEEDDDE